MDEIRANGIKGKSKMACSRHVWGNLIVVTGVDRDAEILASPIRISF